jgi:predicted urease superfamily metal-dependent hydrolase
MPRRSGRSPELSGLELERVLETVRQARAEIIRAEAVSAIGSPHYQALERFREATNDLAEALTGDREHFWKKPHSIGMK